MICKDCLKDVKKLSAEDLCSSCKRRKNILKERYIPYCNLSDDDKKKIDQQRKYNSTYNKKKTNLKSINSTSRSFEDFSNKIEINIDDKRLNEEIDTTMKEAFKKLNLSEEVYISNDYKDLEVINLMIEILDKYKNKEEYNKEREELRKKVEVIDKYIIDILHDLENSELDNDEMVLLCGRKLSLLRKRRRDFKNHEEILKLSFKLQKYINNSNNQLDSYQKEISSFLNATKYKFYNRMVDNAKNDKKLLGLHNFTLECDVVSTQIGREVIKVNEEIQSTDLDSAREKFINMLKEKYGQDVLWSRIKIYRMKG